ncbi:MAG TPA: glycosyltransferase family 1 protein [Isosphaeraceae bacterium]|jgi:glycosyltransferase involved in cell wall biosynthesis|nr:glycosyltransferase family 1 protein [Isosphaeraceae bacterium]
MRLVIDGRRLTAQRTGVGRYLESLLHEWAETRPPCEQMLLVLHDRSGLERIPPISGLQSLVVGERWPGLIWERFGLGRVLRAGDLLFAPANFVPANWGGPTVLVIHDTIMDVMPTLFSRFQRLRYGWRFQARFRGAAREALRVLVPSKTTARDVQNVFGVDPRRIRVIPPGVDAGFRPMGSDADEVRHAREAVGVGHEPFFLFVGKRSYRRNLQAIVAAFCEHRIDNPTHRLVFVGPSSDGMQSDPDRGVIVAGHVSEPVLHGLLASALALLYPSHYEGFGLPMIEAMASGCPVITLANESITETAGDAPLYITQPTPAMIAAAMRDIAEDPGVRHDRVAAGLARARGFTRSMFASTVRAELAEVAASLRESRPTRGGVAARAWAASGSPSAPSTGRGRGSQAP